MLLLTEVIGGVAMPRLRAHAQTDQKALAFDVASIKQNTDAGATPTWLMQQSGRGTITAVDILAKVRSLLEDRVKLEGRTARSEHLVIDHAETPTPD